MAKAHAKKTASLKKTEAAKTSSSATEKSRSYMSQEDIPAYDLDEALLVAKAMVQEYGGHPATPLDVAAAMDLIQQVESSVCSVGPR